MLSAYSVSSLGLKKEFKNLQYHKITELRECGIKQLTVVRNLDQRAFLAERSFVDRKRTLNKSDLFYIALWFKKNCKNYRKTI